MINNVLEQLWTKYIDQNPHAKRVYDLFSDRGEAVINDHIALRTFNHPKIDINSLAAVFLYNGYEFGGEYHFEEKHLYARHYVHSDSRMPKVFISQLELEHFSKDLNEEVNNIVDKILPEEIVKNNFVYSGILWGELSFATYKLLRQESEYAAWLYTNGFVANHFTVSVNHLNSFSKLEEVNEFLKENGFLLNANPDEIKGSPEKYLEQSSIKAGFQELNFKEGKYKVPSCYYEFALRYPMENGELFNGFIDESANKIFESTDSYKQ
jgi:hypothetical protein